MTRSGDTLRKRCTLGVLLLFALAGLALAPRAAMAQLDHGRLWTAYANRFISPDGRVIDPQGRDRTTSEGQSYALFFALVNNDPGRFATLLAWTQANLGQGDVGAHLPAWSWGLNKDGRWGVMDPNSAADSDLWIAYDLLEAGRLWKQPKYSSLGQRMAGLIARREVIMDRDKGAMLLPGPAGFRYASGWITNPSYLPVFILQRLAKLDPGGPWIGIAINTPGLVEATSPGGFAMDWVSYSRGIGYAPSQLNAIKANGAMGSYDAIRVYLWAGMLDAGSPQRAKLLHVLYGMASALRERQLPPEKVSGMGRMEAQAGPVGFSAALLPYLDALGAQAEFQSQLARVQSAVDAQTGLLGSAPTYYDENLTLFSTGWLQRSFRFGANGEVLVPWVHP